MSLTTDRPAPSVADSTPLRTSPPRPVLAVAAAAAVQAAAVSLAAVLVPAVAAWLAADDQRTAWQQAVRWATGGWLLAHHGRVALRDGALTLPPLGLTAVTLAACGLAAAWMSRLLDPRADRIAAGLSKADPSAPPRRALAAFVAAYAAVALLAALLAGGDDLRPDPVTGALGAAVVALLGGIGGAAVYRYGGVLAGAAGLLRHGGLPAVTRSWLRAAGTAVAVHLAGSAILLAVALGLGHERVIKVHQALDPGAVGGGVLTGIQLMLVPDAVIWAAAFAAGPGFALGTGTSVAPAGVVLGALPAVPLLGGLPEPGALPPGLAALLALPVLAGATAGWFLLRQGRSLLHQLGDAAATAVLSGLALGVLAWAAGGAAGPGRMAEVGPAPLDVAVAVGLEVGTGVGAVVLLAALADAVRGLTATRRAGHANQ